MARSSQNGKADEVGKGVEAAHLKSVTGLGGSGDRSSRTHCHLGGAARRRYAPALGRKCRAAEMRMKACGGIFISRNTGGPGLRWVDLHGVDLRGVLILEGCSTTRFRPGASPRSTETVPENAPSPARHSVISSRTKTAAVRNIPHRTENIRSTNGLRRRTGWKRFTHEHPGHLRQNIEYQ